MRNENTHHYRHHQKKILLGTKVVKYNEKFNLPEQTEEDDVGRSWIIISLSLSSNISSHGCYSHRLVYFYSISRSLLELIL